MNKYLLDITKNQNITIVRIYDKLEKNLNDGSYPYSDLGYLCFRNIEHRILVSGLVKQVLALTQDQLEDLVYKISEDIGLDECLTMTIEVVSVNKTLVENLEEDGWFYDGDASLNEWKEIK